MAPVSSSSSLDRQGRNLVERLGGRWGANGGLCRCPAHDDHAPSLSIRPGRSRLLLHCFAGCAASDILRLVLAEGLLEPGPPVGAPDRHAGAKDGRFQAAALRLWGSARPIDGSPAKAYLDARGLAPGSPALRYHPRTPDGPKPLTRFRPALIAAVRDASGLIAVHRTFLDIGGGDAAPTVAHRSGLGRFGCGAVRLGIAGPRLGLAEGIENALSAQSLFGMPCWATLGAERFGSIALPAGLAELHLFLDHDPGGRRAERLARAAYGDLFPIIPHLPPRPGMDWNDVLIRRRSG